MAVKIENTEIGTEVESEKNGLGFWGGSNQAKPIGQDRTRVDGETTRDHGKPQPADAEDGVTWCEQRSGFAEKYLP